MVYGPNFVVELVLHDVCLYAVLELSIKGWGGTPLQETPDRSSSDQ